MFISSNFETERARRLVGFPLEPAVAGAPEGDASAGVTDLPGFLRYSGLTGEQLLAACLKSLAAVGACCLASLLMSNLIPMLLALGILGFQYLQLKRRVFQRAEAFEKDYPAMLLSLASAIRTGLDPLVALLQSEKLFGEKSVLRVELKNLKEAIDRGEAEEPALRALGSTIEHPDIRLFTTAFILARREGSSLAACLQRLTRVTRQRQSFRRKMRAAVAMQRLSSFGIAGCTLVIGVIQALANPQSFKEAFNDPVGIKAFSLGIFLIGAGLLWMIRMTRAKI
jgi:Flp pilus assembly protein TadB